MPHFHSLIEFAPVASPMLLSFDGPFLVFCEYDPIYQARFQKTQYQIVSWGRYSTLVAFLFDLEVHKILVQAIFYIMYICVPNRLVLRSLSHLTKT